MKRLSIKIDTVCEESPCSCCRSYNSEYIDLSEDLITLTAAEQEMSYYKQNLMSLAA